MAYERSGEPPPALVNKPTGGPDLLFYLEEFFKLSSHRQNSGFGASPIAQRDILDRAELVGMSSSVDKLWYLSLMEHLDSVFLEHIRKKQEQAEAQAKAQANAKRGVR